VTTGWTETFVGWTMFVPNLQFEFVVSHSHGNDNKLSQDVL